MHMIPAGLHFMHCRINFSEEDLHVTKDTQGLRITRFGPVEIWLGLEREFFENLAWVSHSIFNLSSSLVHPCNDHEKNHATPLFMEST